MSTVRFGVLGAARIAPAALIRPARALADVRVVAIAARDRQRAAAFAGKHGIATVHDSYEALLADPGSTPSTTRCQTACTAVGPSPRCAPASTYCARSRLPRTRTRPSRWRRWRAAATGW